MIFPDVILRGEQIRFQAFFGFGLPFLLSANLKAVFTVGTVGLIPPEFAGCSCPPVTKTSQKYR